MTGRLHVFEDMHDLSVRTDEECRARNAHHFAAIHVLFFEDAEFLRDLPFLVGQQGVRQVVLFFKLELCLRRVGGDAENDQSGLLQFAVCVAEPARFNGSAGRVGLGIEEQHNVLAAELIERNWVSVFIRQREVGSF